jgi:hypothetical protein
MQEWDKELFVELHETLTILPPLCGIPKGLDKYFKDGKLYQPVIRRKNYITNEWSHFNIACAEPPIAKMDLKMDRKECIFRPKTGFGVPLEFWFKNELLNFLKERILSREFLNYGFNKNFLEQLINEHQKGIRNHRGENKNID